MSGRRVRLAYWSGIVLAPLVFLTQLSLGYALVRWACDSHRHGVLHAVSAIALALSLGALAVEWREWKRVRADAPKRKDATAAQPRFLSQVAIAICVLFSVAIVGVWLTQWVLGPCLG